MMKLPVTFDGFTSRSDGSYGLRFSSQEATEADLGQLHAHNRLFGWLLFSENEVQASEVPKEEAVESKTPSKRLRDVLFVLWKQEGGRGDYELYYREHMEKLITFVKSKLEPEL